MTAKKTTQRQGFKTNEFIVYPAHGVGQIMAIEEQQDGVIVTTTDSHLARGIGEALHHASHGELQFHYLEEDNLLRVHWQR